MLKRTLTGILLAGLSVWFVGQASQLALGDDKPAKKTDDKAAKKAEVAKDQAAPDAKRSCPAAAKDGACPASAEKKRAKDHSKDKAKASPDRGASHSWRDGSPAGFRGGPWAQPQRAWGGGPGRFAGGPWAQGPHARQWDDPDARGPGDHYARGPWGRDGWGQGPGRFHGGPWAYSAYGGRWGGGRFPGHHAWGGGPRGFYGCPWAYGPRARGWGSPQWQSPPWARWGGPRPFGHQPGSFSPWAQGPQGKAQAQWPSADEVFKKLDANSDGVISKEEFAAGYQKIQEKLGGHRAQSGPGMGPFAGPPGMRPPFASRGMVPQAGPQAGKPPSVSDLIDRLDKNKDGKLTKDEAPERLWEHISKADANKDGAVTKDELEAAHKKRMEQFRQKAQEGMAAGKGPWGAGPQPGMPHRGAALFDRFDKNKDGKLTKEEVPPPVWERISQSDSNKDGAVTKEELEAAHKKMVEQCGADKPAAGAKTPGQDRKKSTEAKPAK